MATTTKTTKTAQQRMPKVKRTRPVLTERQIARQQNAWENFKDLAHTAPTLAARDYWTARAETALSY